MLTTDRGRAPTLRQRCWLALSGPRGCLLHVSCRARSARRTSIIFYRATPPVACASTLQFQGRPGSCVDRRRGSVNQRSRRSERRTLQSQSTTQNLGLRAHVRPMGRAQVRHQPTLIKRTVTLRRSTPATDSPRRCCAVRPLRVIKAYPASSGGAMVSPRTTRASGPGRRRTAIRSHRSLLLSVQRSYEVAPAALLTRRGTSAC